MEKYSCPLCKKLIDNNNESILDHINKCANEKPKLLCYGCKKEFSSNTHLNNHIQFCSKARVKCHWYRENGSKCNKIGKYNGYCHLHTLDYSEFNLKGLLDENSEPEFCECMVEYTYIPTTIKGMLSGENYTLDYIFKKGIYNVKSHGVTNVTLENTKTKDTVFFWENKEEKKDKPGFVITQLKAQISEDCSNQAIVKIDDKYYCKECFQKDFKTSVKSLSKKLINCSLNELSENLNKKCLVTNNE